MGEKKEWKSRFGYIMVAAGAAIGLGNIWRFPYLAYTGGGAAFLVVYLIMIVLFGVPISRAESTIGRFGGSNAAANYGKIHKSFRFIGVINILCEFFVGVFYLVVGGWVLKYFVEFVVGPDFGTDTAVYFYSYISESISPLIYAAIIMIITVLLLLSGITELVERASRWIMPLLFFILLGCAVWAVFTMPGASRGLRYYLVPDFGDFTWKVFADVCSQVMWSVGIGCGIYITLGANISRKHNISKDALIVALCDTMVAVVAGFVIIPSVVGSDMQMTSGKALVFEAMTGILEHVPGGRLIGTLFFAALLFAVLSTYVTVIEIPTVYVQERLKLSHKRALAYTAGIIFLLSTFVSLGFGKLSGIKLPWPYATGMKRYHFYDWLDCFTGYFLMPLGCLLLCFFVVKVWGFGAYEKELYQDGRDGKLRLYDKVILGGVCPVVLVIVLLNVFGFIR